MKLKLNENLKNILKTPTEAQECKVFFKYINLNPILKKYMYHVPNGGFRNRLEALDFKRQGLKAGVSDYHLPYPCHNYLGLWLEMKRKKKDLSRLGKEQKQWLMDMKELGYAVAIAYGADQAIEIVDKYLDGTLVCSI